MIVIDVGWRGNDSRTTGISCCPTRRSMFVSTSGLFPYPLILSRGTSRRRPWDSTAMPGTTSILSRNRRPPWNAHGPAARALDRRLPTGTGRGASCPSSIAKVNASPLIDSVPARRARWCATGRRLLRPQRPHGADDPRATQSGCNGGTTSSPRAAWPTSGSGRITTTPSERST